LPKEHYSNPETRRVVRLLDETARRSGVSRGQAFEDFLAVSVCALSGGRMEAEYLAVIARHTEGSIGQRGCDSLAQTFGELILLMEQTRADILGDLFQGAISLGRGGQYLTPEPLCDAMATMTIEAAGVEPGVQKTIADPCCGSGRLLLAAAKLQPHWELVGQDVDLSCVRMTAINLALRNLYGHVIWGDTLANERRLVYRTGFDLRGFICEVPVESVAGMGMERADAAAATTVPEAIDASAPPNEVAKPTRQLHLF
jgi:hypothetical protein